MYYNVAAGNFLSKKLCSILHSIEVDFYSQKRKISLFEPPFGRLRGNVRTSSIARWKARVDFLFITVELFSLALTIETLQAEICRRERFLKGWVNSIAHFRSNGTSPTNHCWVTENYRDCPFTWYKNIVGRFFGLVTKHACDRRTDGRTDGQTDGQTDRITTPKTDRFSRV